MGDAPESQTFAQQLLRWLTPLCRAWLWVRECAYALKPCRSAIILVLAGLAFLLLASQGEEKGIASWVQILRQEIAAALANEI